MTKFSLHSRRFIMRQQQDILPGGYPECGFEALVECIHRLDMLGQLGINEDFTSQSLSQTSY